MADPLIVQTLLAGVGAPLLAVVAAYFWSKFQREALARSDKKIDEAESRVEQEPEKAKPAWDLARVTLEAYFNRNLSQISSIFWLSVVVMSVGFAVVVWGVSQIFVSPSAVT